MYEITCDQCGKLGFHPSRTGAESRAEVHEDEYDHGCQIGPMDDTPAASG